MASVTARSIAQQAMDELNIVGVGQTASADDAAFVVTKLGRILDNWNAERQAVYDEQIHTFTFTPNLQPTTIGPTGTWVMGSRPESIEWVNVLQSSGPTAVRVPVNLVDWAWYMNQRTPGITSTLPTHVYYSTAWPNGELYFWPIPSTAYDVELLTRVVLDSALTLNTVLSLPPGYLDALVLTLAEDIAAPFGKSIAPQLATKARQARARIFNANLETPSLRTRDAGIPGGRTTSGIDWRTGGPWRGMR